MRVLLVGDSHLTETSPRHPTTKLPTLLKRCGLEVVVAAVGGANSRDVLRQQIPGDVDRVLVSVGVNDAAPGKSVGLEEFVANCDHILAAIGARRCLVLGPGPVVERGVAGERTKRSVAAYATALQRVAVAHSARFVSMTELLDDSDVTDDGLHFNDAGYRKLADRVLLELGVSPA